MWTHLASTHFHAELQEAAQLAFLFSCCARPRSLSLLLKILPKYVEFYMLILIHHQMLEDLRTNARVYWCKILVIVFYLC